MQKKKMALTLRKSDVHVEVDFSSMSCNSKLIWNTLFQFLSQLVIPSSSHSAQHPSQHPTHSHPLVVICHGCDAMQPTLLSQFYYYMQDNHVLQTSGNTVQFIFFFLTTNVSLFPTSIQQCCVPCYVYPPPNLTNRNHENKIALASTSASTSSPSVTDTHHATASTKKAKASKMMEMMKQFQDHATKYAQPHVHLAEPTTVPEPSPSLSSSSHAQVGMNALVQCSAKQWEAVRRDSSLSLFSNGGWMLAREQLYHPVIHNAILEDVVFATLRELEWNKIQSNTTADVERKVEENTRTLLRNVHNCCRPIFHIENWMLELRNTVAGENATMHDASVSI